MRMVCAGCGAVVPAAEPYPFRCPAARAGDDIDHVLRRELADGWRERPGESNPFLRYRERLYAYHIARDGGLSDQAFVDLVGTLDRAIAEVDGHGLAATPLGPQPGLAAWLGLDAGAVWVKDETGNVSGSHKVRHLAGILVHLEVIDRLGRGRPRDVPMAIASCGNAALAAAVLARAARRPLQVFGPPWAHPAVVARLQALGAELIVCERDGRPGDPCYRRFSAAVAAGALPFCCQGPDNGMNIEGGLTLGYELVSQTLAAGVALDHLVVQVGGGALASACVQSIDEAVAAGALARRPRIHAVQSTGAAPLVRACDRLRQRAAVDGVEAALAHAAHHRSGYMWPWESEPRSIADGILDDETYDWLQVAAGLLRSGGAALVADESTLAEAHQIARQATPIPVSATGSAGLAGLAVLARSGAIAAGERALVLFTGVQR